MTAGTGQRRRTVRWIILTLLIITAVAAVGAYLTAPRAGGRLDPESTSADGTHALVTLLRDQGVEIIEAHTVADVEQAATPDSLVLIAETYYLHGTDLLRRLGDAPGDRLLIEPTARAREALAPEIRISTTDSVSPEPNCDLRAAKRAGTVQLDSSDTYAKSGDIALTRCYGGAVARYQAVARTITVVGSGDFMTNGALAQQGNAALAMNLLGEKPKIIWYAPQHAEGEGGGSATIVDLIPDAAIWVVWQLCVVVALVAIWRGRRLGPLVAERLPVVVRASETVEGRARLYRARRARSQAANALRAATLHRLTPRLGLGVNASESAMTSAVAQRYSVDEHLVQHTLFGPAPSTDSELLQLANELDNIERQVTQS